MYDHMVGGEGPEDPGDEVVEGPVGPDFMALLNMVLIAIIGWVLSMLGNISL